MGAVPLPFEVLGWYVLSHSKEIRRIAATSGFPEESKSKIGCAIHPPVASGIT